MNIARVFARKTNATPVDELAFYGLPGHPDLLPQIDEVHVSCTFTYDLPWAEQLRKAWGVLGVPVRVGGPAFNEAGGDFTPGMYLKRGYVITSRGCPNRCWFCSVWRREGQQIRELPITRGWNVLDDNLLACSDNHIYKVFDMLEREKIRARGIRVQFTGGLEAARLQRWHVAMLRQVRTKQVFFAYDTPDDYEPLVAAGKMLIEGGFTTRSHILRCYVLIGYPQDTFEKAEQRLMQTVRAGFVPMAMLYRDKQGKCDLAWERFQKQWARPAIISEVMKDLEQS